MSLASNARMNAFAAVAAAPLLASCSSQSLLKTDSLIAPAPVPMTDVLLTGQITGDSADKVLADIAAVPKHHGVRLILKDSPGGLVDAGLEIYHAVRQHPKVETVCKGDISSMAAFLFAMNEKGDRVADADCGKIMFHNISVHLSQGVATLDQITNMNNNFQTNRNIIIHSIARATGMKADTVNAFTASLEDCFLSPQQAAGFGIVNKFSTSARLTVQTTSLKPMDVYAACHTKPYEVVPAAFHPKEFGLE